MKVKTPITIITGYLGAGKTTLLRKLLDYAAANGIKLAVLMNEFGEVGIDTKIIKGKSVDVVEMAGGCVCCSLTGEFEAAVKEVIERFNPTHIVLETTGVAEPDAIIMDVQENLQDVRLDAVVTIADADSLARFPSIGHTGRVQLEMADVLLLNKTDLVSAKQLLQVRKAISELNGRAIIYETSHCNAPIEMLLGVNAPSKKIAVHSHTHSELESFVIDANAPLNKQAFTNFVDNIPKQIYRAKGFVKLGKKTFLFNHVAGRWNLEEWDSEATQLVFIGQNIKKLEQSVRESLERCKK